MVDAIRPYPVKTREQIHEIIWPFFAAFATQSGPFIGHYTRRPFFPYLDLSSDNYFFKNLRPSEKSADKGFFLV